MAHGFTKGPERVVYDGYVIQVAVGEFVVPNGEVVERDLIHHPGAVSVVPIGAALHGAVDDSSDGTAALGLDLQVLVRMFVVMLVVEVAALAGNYL